MPSRLWHWTYQVFRTRPRLVGLTVVTALVLLLGGAYVFWTAAAHAEPPQPIAFNHEVMVQAGVPCLYCHTGATQSAVAGIPSIDKCMGCHRTVATDNPEVKKLTAYWQQQKSIPWVRINRLPRYVYFSHAVHIVAAGLNCERCHGDVGHMAVTQPAVRFTMGFCLSCHKQQPNAPQLMDCVICHK